MQGYEMFLYRLAQMLIAVDLFLKDKIGFLQMSDVVEKCLQTMHFISKPSYDDYVETDTETRQTAIALI